MHHIRSLVVLFLCGLLAACAAPVNVEKVPPVPVSQAAPVYPFELKNSGITGYVVFTYVVGLTGDVEELSVVEASHPEFSKAVTEAVRKWKFMPGTVGGTPVRVKSRQRIMFEMDPNTPQNRR